MYEAYFNNRFTNSLIFYLFFLLLVLISPFLFIWELISTLRSCFQPTENMSGKVVLITGASSGLGELMAYEYAKRGACLSLVAIKEPESRLVQVADRARELGSLEVLFLFADVSKVDECKTFVDETIRTFGRLDHLVCNAGIGPMYSINIDVTKFAPAMDINFWGSVYPTHFAIPHLMRTNGRIVVNASSAGVLHPPKGGFYSASKAALIGFYESLRFQVSPTIKITILTLGFIETNIITAKYSTKGVGARLRKVRFWSRAPNNGGGAMRHCHCRWSMQRSNIHHRTKVHEGSLLGQVLVPKTTPFLLESVFPLEVSEGLTGTVDSDLNVTLHDFELFFLVSYEILE